MVTIAPLTIDDLEEAFYHVPSGEQDAYLDRCDRPGMNYAVYRDGELLGCGGITARPDETEPGVGEAWVLLTPAGRHYKFTSYRAILHLFQAAIAEMGLTHVQALVRHDFVEGHTLLRHLGFGCEWEFYQDGKDGEPYDFYHGVPRKEVPTWTPATQALK